MLNLAILIKYLVKYLIKMASNLTHFWFTIKKENIMIYFSAEYLHDTMVLSFVQNIMSANNLTYPFHIQEISYSSNQDELLNSKLEFDDQINNSDEFVSIISPFITTVISNH